MDRAATDNGDGKEYFAFRATLRIIGHPLDLDAVTRAMGLTPTHRHRKGETHGSRGSVYDQDMWCYTPAVDKEEPLANHIDALWSAVKDQKEYLLHLKNRYTVDLFLGYRSNSDQGGIAVPSGSLDIFVQLGIPFELSIIII